MRLMGKGHRRMSRPYSRDCDSGRRGVTVWLAGCIALLAWTWAPAVTMAADADSSAVADTTGALQDSLRTGPDASGDSLSARPPSRPAQAVEDDREAEAGWVARDTSGFHLEIGARTDITNESYYEDAFVDTTFLGRRLVDTPEQRYASVLAAMLTGTRGARAAQYQLQSEVSYGDLLQRGYAGLHWRSPLGPGWSLHLGPSAEYRHDRTFSRKLEEWRAALVGRARKSFDDGLTGAEIGLRGDLLRASGPGADFLLDRNSAGVSAGLDHLGVLGSEWRIAYALTGRSFPDSAERDHLEHLWEGRYRWASSNGGPAVTLEGLGSRRVTMREVPTSRDNFWDAELSLEARLGGTSHWPVVMRVGGERFHYDLEDSTLFFDYDVVRAQAVLRWEPDVHWALSAGPRAEALGADLNPGEGYQEIAAAIAAEYLGAGSWWSVEPVAGWRDYDETPAAGPGTPPLHSSYAFYELNLIADQPLPGRFRLRVLAALRWESHVDAAQDARSVYVTSELRWAP